MDLKGTKQSPRINNLSPKVPPSTKSRGQVLAEGDVDLAAGSRKEPFKLSVEVLGGLFNELDE